MGGYVKRMRGLRMFFKAENPYGQRIDRLFAEGKPVHPDRTYAVGFVSAQGVPEKYGRNRHVLNVHAVDALRALFESRGTVTPADTPAVMQV